MVKYITGEDLAKIVKSDQVPHKDYLIVDVRDDDYVGGNIKGSHNLPSADFLRSVDELVRKTNDVPKVIFHCALSQARGPKAARIYEETRNMLQDQGKDIPHEVLILRGGFTEFQAQFRDDPKLVENWNAEVWTSEWS
ncbi:hypothetical protein SERLA73DRAFT_138929 [Serpula lacrymans var. lacrymans S7.3]|uniref:Rhodanese domain-containing protein n=2 Tax=Serpula lacrymans var. lacrymans TaxID=341189 RepID=F8PZZ2_SERL3|nr:uncharacterized protein SERLADRAFT_392855 [Serpula lacrymans var. lacrymans S7.9]EGN98464.1 hypothetical protein SERLA73DRAFT_138929 [Serpula lacrymans var. lacrymans S7.3]EGO24043.1 hypothetical protein SERLADRAFT_392855 [Serpula lacrymans var. lacrymans S7.9]